MGTDSYMNDFRNYKPTEEELAKKRCDAFLKCIKNDIEELMRMKIDEIEDNSFLTELLARTHSLLAKRFE